MSEAGETMLPGPREELGTSVHVCGVPESGMPGFKLERIGLVRIDDRLRIDRLAILANRGAVVHRTRSPGTPWRRS